MKRRELFEFEDFQWLPPFIRNGITNLLQVLHKMMGTPQVIAGLITELEGVYPFSQITDLGSGSGGPMLLVLDQLNANASAPSKKLLLTDLYPHPDVVSEINGRDLEHIHYHEQPVDATRLETAPEGLRTMIASFHHMPPESALAILESAAQSKKPILIYEIAKNNIPFLVWLLFLPVSLLILMIMTWFMTPLVRPLRFSQLFFTYLIPVIPMIYAWDGQASLMRTYSFEDIETLLEKVQSPNYRWKVAEARKSNQKALGFYIMGYPVANDAAADT
jgi:hypothetical protein